MQVCLQVCITLLAASTVAYSHLVKSRQHRIKNGNDINISHANFYGLLYCNDAYCGATILGPNKVLSSAQCVQRCTVDDIILVVGLNSLSELNNATKYTASKITIHPKFDKENPFWYDVATIEINTHIIMNDKVGSIPVANYVPEVNSSLQVYGYGMTESALISQTLKTTKLKVVEIEDTLIVTEAVNSSVLPGDAGGPAVYNGQLVGVISGMIWNQTLQHTLYNIFVAVGNPEIYNFL